MKASKLKSSRKKKYKAFGLCCSIFFCAFSSFTLCLLLRDVFKLSFSFSILISILVNVSISVLILIHKTTRCIFFLMIPQFLSKKGRSAVVAYSFYIAITGPSVNLFNNANVLSESLACGQDQLKLALHELIGAVKEPYYTIKEAVEKLIPIVEGIMGKIKATAANLKTTLSSVLITMRKAFSWFDKIANVCNEKSGSPYQKCSKAFERTIEKCREKLGSAEIFCDVTYLAELFCSGLKAVDYFCEMLGFVSDEVLEKIIENTEKFVKNIEDVFYVSASFNHNFDFKTNASKSIQTIHFEVVNEIHAKYGKLFKLINFAAAFTSLFFLWIIAKTLHYKHKFMTSLSYKNCFVTRTFHEIDEKRRELNMDCVLPLTKREQKSYLEMTSIKLVKHEYRMIFEKCFFQLMSTLQVCGILIADFSLFWLLAVVQFNGASIEKTKSKTEVISIDVKGSGLLAEMCTELVKIFKPMMSYYETDLKLCLPRPHHPNYHIYLKILCLILLSWVLLILEPYGFRMRHAIMSSMHPKRSKERTYWLYHHILRKRTSFLAFLVGQQGVKKTMTCWQLFQAKIAKSRILRKIFKANSNFECLLCGASKTRDQLIWCDPDECPGIFCSDCIKSLKSNCPICKRDF